MAFGKKYDISWSDLRGKAFTAEIHQDGFMGSSTPVKAKDTVVEITWQSNGNLLSPIKFSTANLQLYSQTDFEWQEFFVTKVGEYFLKIIQDGNTIWEGMIVDSVYNEPYVDVPYSVNLRFSCGLSELKSIDYLDGSGDFLTGFENLLTIIQRCLNKLPYNLRLKEIINVFDDDMTTTNSMLAETYIDNTMFIDIDKAGRTKAVDCRFVIEEIMKAIGARIFQSSSDPDTAGAPENVWWIQRVEELSNETESQLDYWEYDSNGTLNNSGQLSSLTKTITNKEAGITFLNSDAELEIVPAIKTIKYRRNLVFKWITRNNLVFDEDFCHWIFNADSLFNETRSSFKPRYWFISSTIQNLSNFNQGSTVAIDDDYIIKIPNRVTETGAIISGGGLRFGSPLLAAYDWNGRPFFIEAQFYSITDNPYGPPTPQSTRERIQVRTVDSLICSYDITIHTKLGPNTHISDPSLRGPRVALVFAIILENINTGDTYFLEGEVDIDDKTSLNWVLNIDRIFKVQRVTGSSFVNNFKGTITIPNFPFTGNAKLTFRVSAPYKYDFKNFEGDKFHFIDMVDFYLCDLQYVNDKNTASGLVCYPRQTEQEAKVLEEVVNLQDSDIIRDNDHSITTIIGDGPDEAAMGSFRHKASANSFPITDKWTRLNAPATPTFSARNIFLIDVLRNFLSTQKTMISSTLYGLTDFNFQNIIISDKSVRYIMDGMTWNLKTGEKQVTLLELTTEPGAWTENTTPSTAIPVIPGISPPNVPPVIPGAVVDSGTIVIGTSTSTGGTVTGTDGENADITNYPIQP